MAAMETLAGQLAAFRHTRYRAWTSAGWLDLRVGQRVPALEAAWPAAPALALITAWNPHARRRVRGANERDDCALAEALLRLELAATRAVAGTADRRWREPGWLIGCPAGWSMSRWLRTVDALARRFGQRAVLHWHAGKRVRLRLPGGTRRAAGVEPSVAIARGVPCRLRTNADGRRERATTRG